MGIIETAVAIGVSVGAAASSAAAAVGTAVATATLAEVGTALAIAGAGLSVIGQAAGIKELSYAGMAMGALGGITAIGSSLAGVGGMTMEEAFTSTSNFLTGNVGSTAATAAETASGSGLLNTATQNAVEQGAISATGAEGATPSISAAGVTPEIGAAPPTDLTGLTNAGSMTPESVASPQIQAMAPGAPTPPAPTAPLAPEAPMAPGSGVLNSSQTLPIQNDLSASLATAGQTAPVGTGTVLEPGMQGLSQNGVSASLWEKAKDLLSKPFSGMSSDQKTLLALVAAQGGSGLLGGMFQGMSAQQRLEFDQLVNQQHYNQMQYLNKNNQYAPVLSFSHGGAINATRNAPRS